MNATLLQQHLRSATTGTTVFHSDCPKPAPWCRSVCSPTDGIDMNPIEHVWDALGRRELLATNYPTNSQGTGKSSSGRVGQNTPTRD
ncbi:hypothetical protein TNCV_557831 [Trichonephila clavipes]|nr:hypothetical protein TNCV_557831 [Trichonephila clavipes]